MRTFTVHKSRALFYRFAYCQNTYTKVTIYFYYLFLQISAMVNAEASILTVKFTTQPKPASQLRSR